MGCKLVLFSFLVTISALADSFPLSDGYGVGGYQPAVQTSDSVYYQPNQLWANQVIPQSTQSPVYVWNNKNYEDTDRKHIDGYNYARSANIFGTQQRTNSLLYDNVAPVATMTGYYPQWSNVMLPQQTTPASYNTNNGLSEVWWNNQKPQQSYYGQPYDANSYVNANQGNYGQGYSLYQSAGLVTPKPAVGFGQSWLPQNQYNVISTPTPVEYLPWPVPDNKQTQPIESNWQNEYKNPAVENKANEDSVIPPEKEKSDDQQSIVPSQQRANHKIIISKPYIIVHLNGTYEQVDNLDDIETDEFNIARIKSKEPPDNIITAIYEVEEEEEYSSNETENHMELEVPYDTGITKVPRDFDWNLSNSEHPGTIQSYEYLDLTQATTEDTTYYDMKYFKPEYIMPIQSTTENNIDSTTNFSPLTITTNGNIQSTPENTVIGTTATDSTIVSTRDSNIRVTTDSSIGSTTDIYSDSTIDNSTDNFKTNSTNDNKTVNSTTESTTFSTTEGTTDSTTSSPTVNNIAYITESTTASAIENCTPKSSASNAGFTTCSSIDSSIDSNYESATIVADILFDTSRYSTENTYSESQNPNSAYQTTTSTPQKAQTFDNYYDYENTDYNEETNYNNHNTNSYTSKENPRTIDKDETENNFDGHNIIHSSDSPKWTFSERDNEYDKSATYHEPEQSNDDGKDDYMPQVKRSIPASASYNKNSDLENEYYPEKYNSPIIEKPNRPREDLKIDVSELKTTVKRPLTWFRPDAKFWDKVTQGEQSFDAVTIYDVKCKPKIIERVTTIHHFTNGTELVDFTEVIWDSPDSVNPREIRSKREFRDPKKTFFE